MVVGLAVVVVGGGEFVVVTGGVLVGATEVVGADVLVVKATPLAKNSRLRISGLFPSAGPNLGIGAPIPLMVGLLLLIHGESEGIRIRELAAYKLPRQIQEAQYYSIPSPHQASRDSQPQPP
jgi:hypothetical protein